MARIRVFIVLVIALSAGGVFAYATYNFVQQPAPAASMKTQSVVVAAADLQLGKELKPEDVRMIQFPEGSVPMGTFTSADDIMGRGVISPIVQNEPILSAKLASKEAGFGLPPIIPPGMRAVSVRVNDVVGVAGYVLPGTRVDVVATVNPTQNQTDVTSKVVLANVQVLTSGTKIEQDGDKGKPMEVSVVTLLVDPSEAERLTLASTEGKIQLALRNPLDKTAPVTSGVRPAALLAYGAAPRPVSAPRPRVVAAVPVAVPVIPPAPTVEMIRGDKRAQEVVRQE
jgi:pilus assembly protein CpaB